MQLKTAKWPIKFSAVALALVVFCCERVQALVPTTKVTGLKHRIQPAHLMPTRSEGPVHPDERELRGKRLGSTTGSEFEYITLEHSASYPKSGLRLGTNVDNAPALVLNADFTPLSFMPLSLWSWQDSLRAVFSGRAVAVNTYPSLMVKSVSCTFTVPSVIALTQFHKVPNDKGPALSRRNVYLRDGFKCQYCLERFAVDQLSLDHLVPRSKGGKLTWTNTVTACCSCNFKKGSSDPADLPKLGMRLRNAPREPSRQELNAKARLYKKQQSQIYPHWADFL